MTRTDDPMADLVLGAAYDYSEEQLAPFVTSLRATGYTGRIALVVREADARRHQGSRLLEGVDLVVAPTWRPSLPDIYRKRATIAVWLPFAVLSWVVLQSLRVLGPRAEEPRRRLAARLFSPVCARNLDYLPYLEEHDWANVMLADTRDVVFQVNPSTEMRARSGLCVGIETPLYTLGSEFWNSRWIKAVYGARTLAELADRPVSCAGVTFGDGAAMRAYVRAMSRELLARPFRSTWHGTDQAVHNVLLWTGRLGTFHRMQSLHGPIATLNATPVDDLEVVDGRLRNDDGTVVCVVHQYDRVDGLAARIGAYTAAVVPPDPED